MYVIARFQPNTLSLSVCFFFFLQERNSLLCALMIVMKKFGAEQQQ